MKIKRYRIEADSQPMKPEDYYEIKDKDGEWVKYEDIKELIKSSG